MFRSTTVRHLSSAIPTYIPQFALGDLHPTDYAAERALLGCSITEDHTFRRLEEVVTNVLRQGQWRTIGTRGILYSMGVTNVPTVWAVGHVRFVDYFAEPHSLNDGSACDTIPTLQNQA